MTRVTLSVPDDLFRKAKARLGSKSQSDIQEYLVSALEALTADGKPIDKRTASQLLEGLESPLKTMTPADWSAKLRAYDTRHRKLKRA